MNAGLARQVVIDAPALAFQAELRLVQARPVGPHQHHVGQGPMSLRRFVHSLAKACILGQVIQYDLLLRDLFRFVVQHLFRQFHV